MVLCADKVKNPYTPVICFVTEQFFAGNISLAFIPPTRIEALQFKNFSRSNRLPSHFQSHIPDSHSEAAFRQLLQLLVVSLNAAYFQFPGFRFLQSSYMERQLQR